MVIPLRVGFNGSNEHYSHFLKCFLRGRCWSAGSASCPAAPQFLDVVDHLKPRWAGVLCQTKVLGYQVLQLLFLTDVFPS